MGATSAWGDGVGHTPEDATANRHPHYGTLAHKEGCGGARALQASVISCAKVQNPARLGQIEATVKSSVGQRGISWVLRMFLKLHPLGNTGTGWKGTFPTNLCARSCSLGIGPLQQLSDVGREREHELPAQSHAVGKWLSQYSNAQNCVAPKPSRILSDSPWLQESETIAMYIKPHFLMRAVYLIFF